jgi:release factor glutamine methyltransferase
VRPSEVLTRATAYLERHGVDGARESAEALMMMILSTDRAGLYARTEGLSTSEARTFGRALCQRCAGTPLQHLTGEQAFRRITVTVRPGVFIPRPETEVLVERCLEHLRDLSEPRVLDVGVGSGGSASAIADEHSAARILAVDRSADALAAARENLARTPVDGRMEFRQGDLLAGISGPFDLVVSNPPYVSPEDFDTLEPEVRLYEPRESIVGVGVGAEIARGARAVLAPGGWLLLECGDGQAADLAAEFERDGYGDVVRTRDLADRERVVEGRWA